MNSNSPSDGAYWMQPRELMNREEVEYTELRAAIAYGVLFNGKVVVSDSDFVNSLHLRNFIRDTPWAQEAIRMQHIVFAAQFRDGSPIEFRQTAERLRKNGGFAKIIPEARYCQSSEFDFVQRNANFLEYSFNGAAERYTRETLKVFDYLASNNRALATAIPIKFARVIQKELRQRVAAGQQLRWAIFEPESAFWNDISKQLGCVSLSMAQRRYVFNVARGPYATFIPEALKIGASYSNEDALGVNLWRGRATMEPEILAERTLMRARISLTDYVHGLSLLTNEEIQKLRMSDECKGFESSCRIYSSSLKDIATPINALHGYRRKIDDAILNAIGRSSKTMKENYIVTILEKCDGEGDSRLVQWIKFCVKFSIDSILGGAPSILGFLLEQVYPRPSKLLQQEIDKERHIGEWNRSALGKSFDSRHLVVDESVRDFFVSNTMN